MNAIELIPDNLRYDLGWTLIHSLWQGFIIFIITLTAQWFISKKNSSLRYFISCLAIGVQLILLIGTFIYLREQHQGQFEALQFVYNAIGFNIADAAKETTVSFIVWCTSVINANMTWLIAGWITGVVLFTLRLLGGLFYLRILRSRITDATSSWKSRLDSLSIKIGVRQLVALGESIHINKPIVIGFIKPIILLPIGLVSHLSTQQVEAILTHELIHIRRHDYLVNLIQSVIEVLLFFNPFTWLLSSMIRRERENCCDDMAIASGLNPLDYVRTLAVLEELSTKRDTSLAMAFNRDKFQVLNRIKRIMENTVHPTTNKMRPVAILVLLLTGLTCAAWLSPDNNVLNDNSTSSAEPQTVVAAIPTDTTRKQSKEKIRGQEKKEKSASYSRKTITTFDENGDPHEEVIEEYEGDEELRPLFANPPSMSFTIPPIPDLPHIDLNGFAYSFDNDSIPPYGRFSEKDREAWEKFGREMSRRFEHFGEEQEDFGRMMEAWAENFAHDFTFNLDGSLQESLDQLNDQLKDLEHNEEFTRGLEHGLRDMEENLRKMEEQLRAHEGEFKQFEDRMKDYEQELHDQLVEDGYIKKGERIESMNWNGDELSINGIRIRERDIEKYERLNKKYLTGKRGFYFHN